MAIVPIINQAQLEIAARKAPGSLDENAYAAFVIQTASEIACDAAEHPDWEDDTSDVLAPRQAKRVAVAVAVRALLNPEMETSWNTGPLGARNRDEWAYGFQLTPYELEQLQELIGVDGENTANGLWVMSIDGGLDEIDRYVYKKDPWYARGSSLILYQENGDVGTGYDDEAS